MAEIESAISKLESDVGIVLPASVCFEKIQQLMAQKHKILLMKEESLRQKS